MSLFTALAKAQAEFPKIRFDSEAKMREGGKPYRYASLEAILEVVRPVLNRHGVFLTQETAHHDGVVSVTTKLVNQDGVHACTLEAPLPRGGFHDMGSAITYLRRYSLASLLGVSADEDEDGHAAQATARAQGSSSAPARQRTPEPATTEAAGPAPTPPAPAASGGEAAALPFRGRILDHRTGTKRNGQPWCKIRVGNPDGEQREYWVPPKWLEFVANNKDEDVVWLCSAGAPRDGVAALSELYYITSTGASVHPDLGTIPF